MSDGVTAAMKPSAISVVGDAWILQVPRLGEQGTHYQTYGLLTPYFRARFRMGHAATHTCLDLYWVFEREPGDFSNTTT